MYEQPLRVYSYRLPKKNAVDHNKKQEKEKKTTRYEMKAWMPELFNQSNHE